MSRKDDFMTKPGTTYYKYNKNEVQLLTRTLFGYTLTIINVIGEETKRELFLYEGIALLEKGGWTLKVLD